MKRKKYPVADQWTVARRQSDPAPTGTQYPDGHPEQTMGTEYPGQTGGEASPAGGLLVHPVPLLPDGMVPGQAN